MAKRIDTTAVVVRCRCDRNPRQTRLRGAKEYVLEPPHAHFLTCAASATRMDAVCPLLAAKLIQMHPHVKGFELRSSTILAAINHPKPNSLTILTNETSAPKTPHCHAWMS